MNKPLPPANDSALPYIHVHKLMLYLAIVGLTMIFLVLTAAYLFSSPNWHWQQYPFPAVFVVSTLALLGGSYTMHKAVQACKQQQTARLLYLLRTTAWFSMLFAVGQMLGWYKLQQNGIYMAGKPDGSYLYLISGLHLLHVLVGIGWLLYVWHKAKRAAQQPTEHLLLYVQPHYLRQVEMLTTYWHFVDVLWIYLLVFFLFSYI